MPQHIMNFKNIIKIGIVLIAFGFLYDIIFAGIPFQDAPTELQIKYERHRLIAVTTMQIGLGIAIIGILLVLIKRQNKV